MGEEKEILLRGKVCAYLTCRLMGDPPNSLEHVAVKAARAASLGKSINKLNRDLTALSYLLSTWTKEG